MAAAALACCSMATWAAGGLSLHGIPCPDDGSVGVVPGVVAGDPDENSDAEEQDDYGEGCALGAVVAAGEPQPAESAGLDDAGEVVDSTDREPE